jgi:hypothetical protein
VGDGVMSLDLSVRKATSARSIRLLALCLSFLSLAGCPGNNEGAPTAPPTATPRVLGVTVSPASASLEVGKSLPLSLSMQTENSPSLMLTVTSSNSSVATISFSAGNASVVGVSPGQTTISARSIADPTKVGTALITVVAAPSPAAAVLSVAPSAVTISSNGGRADVYFSTNGPGFDLSVASLPETMAFVWDVQALGALRSTARLTLIAGATTPPGTYTGTVRGVSAGTAYLVSFGIVIEPLTPGALQIVEGNGLIGTAGKAVAVLPSVRVVNSAGLTVQGAPVTFSIVSGGGTITGAEQLTGATGVATVGSWTLGAATGVNTLSARVGSLPPVIFTVTGSAQVASVALSPATVSMTSGQSSVLTLTARDVFGNVLAGRSVQWNTSNAGIVRVSGTGVIDAVSPGNASVTASVDGITARAAITVVAAAPAAGRLSFWTDENYTIGIAVGDARGTIASYFPTLAPTCGQSGTFTVTLPPGTQPYSASYGSALSWSNDAVVTSAGCTLVKVTVPKGPNGGVVQPLPQLSIAVDAPRPVVFSVQRDGRVSTQIVGSFTWSNGLSATVNVDDVSSSPACQFAPDACRSWSVRVYQVSPGVGRIEFAGNAGRLVAVGDYALGPFTFSVQTQCLDRYYFNPTSCAARQSFSAIMRVTP